MKSVQTLLCAVALLAATSTARATFVETWYFTGSDGCSEYIVRYDKPNNAWQSWYRCCDSESWCYDSQGWLDPCGLGMVLPNRPGNPVANAPNGYEIITVAPGRGGRIGPVPVSSSGTCFPFTPDGSDYILAPVMPGMQ